MPRRTRNSGIPDGKPEAACRISICTRKVPARLVPRIVNISVNNICLDTCLKHELTSATAMRVSLFNAGW
jgi:hypothetical protein